MVCKQEPPGPKPSLSGLLKIQLLYVNNATVTNKAANVMHARWVSNTNHSLADITSLAGAWSGTWNADVWAKQSSSWFLYNTVVTSLGGDGLEASHPSNLPGGNPQPALPPNSATCISWLAGLTARGGRARTYLPGVPADALVSSGGSELSTPYASGLVTAAQSFLNTIDAFTIGGDSAIVGVPSYYHNCQLRPVPLFFMFQAPRVHQRLDSQRRRSGKETIYPIS